MPRTVSTASGRVEFAERGGGEPIRAIHGTLGGWEQALVAVPGRTAQLEATLRGTLGAKRRRRGLENDFRPFAPASLDRVTFPTLIVHALG